MRLDAFKTNGTSPPRVRALAYRLRTVTLRLGEPPTQRLSDAASALAYLRPIFAGLDGDREHFVLLALDAQNGGRGYKVGAGTSRRRGGCPPSCCSPCGSSGGWCSVSPRS